MADRNVAWKKYQSRMKAIRTKVRSILRQASTSSDASAVAELKSKLGK